MARTSCLDDAWPERSSVHVYIQVKAAEELQAIGSDYVFDLDIRDYNLWILEEMPVILILS
jgi:hypothetical protein